MARECANAHRLSVDEDGEATTNPGEQALTSAQLEAWSQLRQKAKDASSEHRITLSHLPTGSTRAAWDHGKTCGPCVSWRLDHIFFTSRTLKLHSSWTALES